MKKKKITRKSIIAKTKELTQEERRLLIVDIIRQQRHSYPSRPDCVPEFCTLIDLQTGIIAGSGICPKCEGFLGRLEEFQQ